MKELSILLLLLTTQIVWAGNEGGGGGAVVCRGLDRKIESAELLDLFEAPVVHDLDIEYSDRPYMEQVEAALEKIRPSYFEYLRLKEAVKAVKKQFKFLPAGVSLNQPADVGENTPVVVREGCALEGVGFYKGKGGNLLVAKATFDKFSETDKAAFILHEAVYKLYRILRPVGSVLSRQMTANLFSRNVTDEDTLDFLKKKIVGPIYGMQKHIHVILPPKTTLDNLEIRSEERESSFLRARCTDFITTGYDSNIVYPADGTFEVIFENKNCRDLSYEAGGPVKLYYNNEFIMDLDSSGYFEDVIVQFARKE